MRHPLHLRCQRFATQGVLAGEVRHPPLQLPFGGDVSTSHPTPQAAQLLNTGLGTESARETPQDRAAKPTPIRAQIGRPDTTELATNRQSKTAMAAPQTGATYPRPSIAFLRRLSAHRKSSSRAPSYSNICFNSPSGVAKNVASPCSAGESRRMP